jgi:hypothetical protein
MEQEKKWKYTETVYQLFICFQKAYDSMKREILYNMELVSLTKLHQAHRSPVDHANWHRTDSLSLKPSSTPCYGTAQLVAQRVPGRLPYTSPPRRTTVGVPAATTEGSTHAPFPTANPSAISTTTLTIFSVVRSSPRSI